MQDFRCDQAWLVQSRSLWLRAGLAYRVVSLQLSVRLDLRSKADRVVLFPLIPDPDILVRHRLSVAAPAAQVTVREYLEAGVAHNSNNSYRPAVCQPHKRDNFCPWCKVLPFIWTHEFPLCVHSKLLLIIAEGKVERRDPFSQMPGLFIHFYA